MTISIIGASRAFATSQANITFAKPGVTIQNGDVLVAVITHQNNANTWTLPDGTWSRIGNAYAAGDVDYRGDIIAAHVVTNAGSEPSTYTFSYAGGTGRVAGRLIVFRGVDTSAIDDGHPASKALTTTGNVRTMPSFTVGHDDSYLLWLANNNLVSPNAAGVTLTGTDTQLDFLSSVGDTDNTGVTRTLLAIYGRQLGAAGASPTPSVTWPAVSGANIMAVALKAAPTGSTPPTAEFTSAADDLTVQFTDASTAGTNPITSRSWDFGDGQTSTATSPKHYYGTPGTYTVKLTVSDGATPSTATHTVTVDGVAGWYWGGATDPQWHEVHVSEVLSGGTEKGISELVVVIDTAPTWSQMKASGEPLDAIHRGGSANYVEFSTDGFQAAAIRWPHKAHELSVRWSADNHPWLIHDASFDRTVLQTGGGSGTTYPIASMTDAQIAALRQTAWQTDNTSAPSRPPMPLLPIAGISLVSWMELYGGKRNAFIEDKTYTHQAALLDIMDANGGPDRFVWKQAGAGTLFSQVPARGYDSWGYLFDNEMAASFASKQAQWTFIGLDYNSSDATLDPAIATAGASRTIMHIIPSAAQATRLRGKGVRGLMISAPRQVAPTF